MQEDGGVAVRGRGERVRTSVSATMGIAATAAEPAPQRAIQTHTIQMSAAATHSAAAAAAAATNAHGTAATGSRPAAPAALYRAGPEPGGRGPPPGYGAYTRNRVNALPPQTGLQTGQQGHPAVERGLPFSNLHAHAPSTLHVSSNVHATSNAHASSNVHAPSAQAVPSLPSHGSHGSHGPYLHMASGMSAGGAAVNARRRVGTVPGPSVSTTDLPGMLRGGGGDEAGAGSAGSVGGRRASSRRATASGEGEGLGPDDMVMG